MEGEIYDPQSAWSDRSLGARALAAGGHLRSLDRPAPGRRRSGRDPLSDRARRASGPGSSGATSARSRRRCGAWQLGFERIQLVDPPIEGERRRRHRRGSPSRSRSTPRTSSTASSSGPGNRFAHAAALAVAEAPGEAYNPLYLHGPPGPGQDAPHGRDRELHARHNHPELTVHYTTAERFTSEFVTALRTHGPERFKQRYRGLDALLIDDVQFLEGKEKHRGGVRPHLQRAVRRRQADRACRATARPARSSALEERLRDRFEWGLDRRARRRPTSAPASHFSGASPPTRSTACPSPTSCARSQTARRATSGGSKVRLPGSSPFRPSTSEPLAGGAIDRALGSKTAGKPARARFRRRPQRQRDPGRGLLRARHLASRPSLRQAHAGRRAGSAPRDVPLTRAHPALARLRSRGSSTAITPPSSTRSAPSASETSPDPPPPGISTASVQCLGETRPAPDPEDPGSQHSRVPSTRLINMPIPHRH